MKITGATIALSCLLSTAAVLGSWLVFERQAVAKLDRKNAGLRERLNQIGKLVAQNERLSNSTPQAVARTSRLKQLENAPSDGDEPAAELVRLRTEVEKLRQQSEEIKALRADTRQVRVAPDAFPGSENGRRPERNDQTLSAGGPQLEIVSAGYWTDNTNMDVTAELSDRIRGDSLKAVASNNLKGDPEFGQVKHLTVVYRFGGVTMTNEFREGELIMLPKE